MSGSPTVFKTGLQALKAKKAAPFLGPRFKRGKGLGWVSQKQCKAPLRQAKRLKERCRKQMEKSEGHWLVRPLLLMDSRCTCAAKRRDAPLRRAAESQLHAKYGSYAESNGSERAETAGPAGKGECRILHIHCTPILPRSDVALEVQGPRSDVRGPVLGVARDRAQFARQKMIRRPGPADQQLAVFQLLGGAAIAVLILLH
jgi:hypothetical protein